MFALHSSWGSGIAYLCLTTGLLPSKILIAVVELYILRMQQAVGAVALQD